VESGIAFCAHCGRATNDVAAPAPLPQAPPIQVARYCQTCGNGVVAAAVVCPRCGSAIAGSQGMLPGGKSKTTAVLLAVFLSFWSWLYTFKKNQWKFWIGLGAAISVIILFYVAGSLRRNDTTLQCQFYNHCAGGGYGLLAAALALGVWIWAIIDVSTKSPHWYQTYSDR
jgi:hypothetical protein